MSWHNCDLWSVVWFSVKAMLSATTYSHFILLHPLTSSWKSKNSLYIFHIFKVTYSIPQSVSALYRKLKLNVKCYHWPFIYASAVCHNLVIAFRQICRVSTAFLYGDKHFESSQGFSCCKVLVLSLTELQIPLPTPSLPPSYPCHCRKSCTPGKGIWSCSRNSIRNFKPWTDFETYQIWAAWWVTGNGVQCVSLPSTGGCRVVYV